MMARVEKVRGELRRFEQEDVPAFGRWMAACFGALLTRTRELGSLIAEKEMLIREVEDEIFFTGAKPREAYKRVMRRRTQPQADFADREPPPEYEDGQRFKNRRKEPDEFEKEMMFEEVLEALMGVDPSKLDDETYESMFEEFKRKVFGRGSGTGRGSAHEPPPFREEMPASQPPNPDAARIKEIYRTLVRRLHPDLRADGNAAVSSLWHEVQEAYGSGNLERLETLLALTDIQSSQSGDHISFFQMRSVLAELERDLKALQKSLRRAKKEDAWDFTRGNTREALKTRIQRDLETKLAEMESNHTGMDALLESWAAPPARQRQGRQPGRSQVEFSF